MAFKELIGKTGGLLQNAICQIQEVVAVTQPMKYAVYSQVSCAGTVY